MISILIINLTKQPLIYIVRMVSMFTKYIALCAIFVPPVVSLRFKPVHVTMKPIPVTVEPIPVTVEPIPVTVEPIPVTVEPIVTVKDVDVTFDVLESALSYLDIYNNSYVKKYMPSIYNVSIDIDTAVMADVGHSVVNEMVQDVFEGRVSPKIVEKWSDLEDDQSFMYFSNVGGMYLFFVVKHDIKGDSYSFAISRSGNDVSGMSSNKTVMWSHSDSYNYTYKPSVFVNGSFPYDDIFLFRSGYSLNEEYTNAVRWDEYLAVTKTILSHKYLLAKPVHTKKRFNEITGQYELAGPWDAFEALLKTMGNVLNFNISKLGNIVNNMTGTVVPVETCLGFDRFNTSVSTGQMECVAVDSVPDMVVDVCKEMLWAAGNNSAELQAQLDEFKWAQNETWTMSHIDFSSFNVTHPQYARIWKSVDPTNPKCTNWVITIVRGTVKIAPDIFAKVTQEEVGWGLWSETKVDLIYEPHTVTPADVIALDTFFRSIIHINECDTVGVPSGITGFPKIDC